MAKADVLDLDEIPPPRPRRPAVAGLADAAACLLVLAALLLPDDVTHVTPALFLRLPVEGIVGVGLLLVLPERAGRIVAALGGAVLGLMVLLRALDLGFLTVLDRPFDPVLDWVSLGYALELATTTLGRPTAIGLLVAVVAAALGLLVALIMSTLRLRRLTARHRPLLARGVVALGVVWTSLAGVGAHAVPGVPFAARSTATMAYDRALLARAAQQDRAVFAAESAADPFRDVPGEQLLTGLRGKDVVIAFVESYGRSAVEDPQLAPPVVATLAAGEQRLRAAGYLARSAYLTSPTVGGGSWLAHATLLSGVRIDTQQRYRNLVAGDRLTLNGAFQRAGWRTVGVMPGVTRAWPEGRFFGYDQVYDSRNLGYRGPHFGWAPMPDQYVLSAFQRLERATTGRAPVMAEIPLVSSHGPWTPLPRLIDWDDVGDGAVFGPMAAAGTAAAGNVSDPAAARTAYRRSIAYSLETVISYVERYGDDDLVLVFLGDHQPAPLVTGAGASRDVPVTIVARDPAVLDHLSGWGWQDGLRPAPQSPVWPMPTFRDRFLTAFGPADHVGGTTTRPPA